MKRFSTIFLIAILIAGVIVGAIAWRAGTAQTPTPTTAQEASTQDTSIRTVTVSGTGTAEGAPDTAIVVIGVQSQAEEASAALMQNNDQMDQLLSALTGAGIPRENIQTQFFQLFPQYQGPSTPDEQPEITGYIATNTVQVRAVNLTDLGELLDAAVEAGGNLIENVRFEISNRDTLLEQAREEAFNDAAEKAEQLAGFTGGELGRVISINESGAQPFMPFGLGGGAAAGEVAVPIEPGSQTVTANLQVTWELVGGE